MYLPIWGLILVIYVSANIVQCVRLIRNDQFSFSVWTSWVFFVCWLVFGLPVLAGCYVWYLILGDWPLAKPAGPSLHISPRR